MSKQKISADIRYGLIYGYDCICPCCLENKKRTELVIDHIIPEDLLDKKNLIRKNDILKKYELDSDFDLKGLLNLRPLCIDCNLVKSNNDYGEITKKALQKAANKLATVTRLIKQYNNDKRIEIDLKYFENAKTNGTNLELLLDQVTGRIKNFPQKKERTQIENSLKISNSTVILTSFLPTSKSPQGACLFEFNVHYLRDALITLNHFDILNCFYENMKIPIENGTRKFITKSFNTDEYMIDIGNVRFFLNEQQTQELLDIVDEFMVEYISEIMNIQKENGVLNLVPIDKEYSTYKIAYGQPYTWYILKQFIYSHDINSNNIESKWNIFDSSENMIKILNKKTNDYYAFIKVEHYLNAGNNIDIKYLWWDMSGFYMNKLWKPEKAQYWLIHELVPTAFEWYSKKINKKNVFKSLYSQFQLNSKKNEFILSDYISKNFDILLFPNESKTYSDFSKIFYNLCNFYKDVQVCLIKTNDILSLVKSVNQELYSNLNVLEADENLEYDINNVELMSEKINQVLVKNNFEENKELFVKGHYLSQIFDYTFRVFNLFDKELIISSISHLDFCNHLADSINFYNENRQIQKIKDLYNNH